MSVRPYPCVGRLALRVFAVLLAAASLKAQTATPAEHRPARVDLFLGYSYFHPFGSAKLMSGLTGSYSSVNIGGIGSVVGYFNDHVGLQFEAAAHPDGGNDGLYTMMIGPIVRWPHD